MAHKIPPYEMISFCPHRWLDGENLGYRSMEMGEAQVPESLCGSLSIKQLQRIVRGTRNKLVLSLGLGVSVCAVCAQSCLTLCGLPGSFVHGIFFRQEYWILFQRIFPTQGSKPCLSHLLHYR